jgi:RHS repeat-associated protein
VPLVDGSYLSPVTTTSYSKNGNATRVVDPNDNVIVNTYDTLNRLTSTRQQVLPTSSSSADIVVSYAYDAGGNRTGVTDGEGQTTSFSYDGLKRNTAIIANLPGGALTTVTHTYSALYKTGSRQPVDANSANDRVATYSYDTLGRLTDVAYNINGGADDRHHVYDANGNLLAVVHTLGSAAKDNIGYAYDAFNRVLSETQGGSTTVSGGTVTISGGVTTLYAYDLANNRTSVEYPGGATVLESEYDPLNRLATLTETTGSVSRTTTYGYDLGGNRVSLALDNGDTTLQDFDALGRVTASATGHFTSGGVLTGLILASQSAHDLAGNLVQLQEDYFSSATPPRTLNLSYDFANRLVLESVLREGDGILTAWDYDQANNRTRRTVATVASGGATTGVTTTYSYTASGFTPTQFNQLARYTDGTKTVSFTYDRSGNRLTRAAAGQTDTYAYDAENRLVTLTKSTTDTGTPGTFTYSYDYRTRRIERRETIGGTTTTTSLVFSGGTSVQEYTGTVTTSNLAAQFVRGSDWGGGVGGLLYSVRGGTPSFKHYNSRGDVLAESNATGASTWRAQYDAYGTRSQESGTASADRQRGNTKEEDPAGLRNDGFRYFDLDAQIYVTADPLGFVDGPNVYAYVVQNPWSKFDPEGLSLSDYNPLNKPLQMLSDMYDAGKEKIKQYNEAEDGTMKDAVVGVAVASAKETLAIAKDAVKTASPKGTGGVIDAGFGVVEGISNAAATKMVAVTGADLNTKRGMIGTLTGTAAPLAGSLVAGGRSGAGGRAAERTVPRLAGAGEDLFVGTYRQSYRANVRAGLNSTHTAHHSLQDAVSLTSHGRGITINLRKDLHELTRTLGTPVEEGLTLRQHLARDVMDLRSILRNADYDPSVINRQLQELIRQNKAVPGFPGRPSP